MSAAHTAGAAKAACRAHRDAPPAGRLNRPGRLHHPSNEVAVAQSSAPSDMEKDPSRRVVATTRSPWRSGASATARPIPLPASAMSHVLPVAPLQVDERHVRLPGVYPNEAQRAPSAETPPPRGRTHASSASASLAETSRRARSPVAAVLEANVASRSLRWKGVTEVTACCRRERGATSVRRLTPPTTIMSRVRLWPIRLSR